MDGQKCKIENPRWYFDIRRVKYKRRNNFLVRSAHNQRNHASHTPGRNAHHCGCKAMAFIPLWTILKRRSCSRGSADSTFRGVPPGRVAPVQKTSAELAARGQAIESKFSGDDCSVHSSCCPPSTNAPWAVVRFARGLNV